MGASFNQCLIMYVFLEHIPLYRLIWRMLSPYPHNCGDPSFGNLNELSLSSSATFLSSSSLMMNSFSGTRFHSSFPENLTMSSRQFVLHLFFWDIPTLRYPDTNHIRISVRYDGWNIFSRVITLVFMWPGKVMSCLAHLAGGPIVIVSLLARLSILPWGNCKTYSTSYSWWIHWVSKVRPLLEDHVNAISKHVRGTPIFNKNSWSNAIFSLSIIQNTVVWVLSSNSSPPT